MAMYYTNSITKKLDRCECIPQNPCGLHFERFDVDKIISKYTLEQCKELYDKLTIVLKQDRIQKAR